MTNFKIQKDDIMYVVEHDRSDNADSISCQTSVVLVRFAENTYSIPNHIIEKVLNEEYGVDYIAKIGGYAQMVPNRNYHDNIDLKNEITFDFENPIKLYGEYNRGVLSTMYIANLIIIEWNGITGEYTNLKVFDDLKVQRTPYKNLSCLVDEYNEEVEKIEHKKAETKNIDNAIDAISKLNKSELKAVLAKVLAEED